MSDQQRDWADDAAATICKRIKEAERTESGIVDVAAIIREAYATQPAPNVERLAREGSKNRR